MRLVSKKAWKGTGEHERAMKMSNFMLASRVKTARDATC